MFIQFLVFFFVVFAISAAVFRYRRHEMQSRELAFWVFLWIVIGIVVALPRLTEYLASFLGVGRGVDAIVYLAVIGLVYALFRTIMKIEHLEQEITTIVRELAIRKTEKETKDENTDTR